jgi:hypothetical protein
MKTQKQAIIYHLIILEPQVQLQHASELQDFQSHAEVIEVN